MLLLSVPFMAGNVRRFLARAVYTVESILPGSGNIYDQQYQMGLFFKQYYDDQAVVVNDIGAVCFLADVDCVDVYGLANCEAARLKLRLDYDSPAIGNLIREKKARVAIIYEDWLGTADCHAPSSGRLDQGRPVGDESKELGLQLALRHDLCHNPR